MSVRSTSTGGATVTEPVGRAATTVTMPVPAGRSSPAQVARSPSMASLAHRVSVPAGPAKHCAATSGTGASTVTL